MWKVLREIRRVQLRGKIAIIKALRLNSSIAYEGLTIPLGRAGMSAEILMGIERGAYEAPEITGLRRILRSGDRVLELGAGLGVITAITAKSVLPEGRVLSFEAIPELVPETRAFLDRHGAQNVELRNAVLVPNAKPGDTRKFHVARVFAVSSLLDSSKFGRWNTISVPAEDLNAVVGQFRPDVLVCDIEGGEIELVPALDASSLRAVIIEMHPRRLSESQIASVRDALELQGLIREPESPGGTVEIFVRSPPP
jgi:FkbM family methyltransferase